MQLNLVMLVKLSGQQKLLELKNFFLETFAEEVGFSFLLI